MMTPTPAAVRADQLRLGLWMFLATVTMLFSAFSSAYIVRRSGTDWHHVALPSILWINSALLAGSSALVEAASWWGSRSRWTTATTSLSGAVLLGVAFLAGQVQAWRQLAALGVYLPTTPHSSFFFMLTGAHGLHVVAALAVLVWGLVKTRSALSHPREWSVCMELCRTFWHYLGGVWLFLFALISLY